MTLRPYAVLTLVALLLLAPVIAVAGSPFKDIEVTGDAMGGGTFKGMLSIERFERAENGVVAKVSVNGTLVDPGGATRQLTGQTMSIPVAIGSASCDAATLELAASTIDVGGTGVGLATMIVAVKKDAQTDDLVARLLCQISKAASEPPADSPLATRLNRLLDEME